MFAHARKQHGKAPRFYFDYFHKFVHSFIRDRNKLLGGWDRRGGRWGFYVTLDDDRRLVTSDVTAYVNKNQYRVVQLPFKV